MIDTNEILVCREIKATLKSAEITFRQVLINCITDECTWWSFITFALNQALKAIFDRNPLRHCIFSHFAPNKSQHMTSKNNSLEAWILHHESASVASFWTSEGIFFSSRNFAHLKPVVRFTIELHDHYGKNIFWSLWHHSIRLHFTSIILRMHKRHKEQRYQWKIRFRGFVRRWRCRDCDIEREKSSGGHYFFYFHFFNPGRPRRFSRSTRKN